MEEQQVRVRYTGRGGTRSKEPTELRTVAPELGVSWSLKPDELC